MLWEDTLAVLGDPATLFGLPLQEKTAQGLAGLNSFKHKSKVLTSGPLSSSLFNVKMDFTCKAIFVDGMGTQLIHRPRLRIRAWCPATVFAWHSSLQVWMTLTYWLETLLYIPQRNMPREDMVWRWNWDWRGSWQGSDHYMCIMRP